MFSIQQTPVKQKVERLAQGHNVMNLSIDSYKVWTNNFLIYKPSFFLPKSHQNLHKFIQQQTI